jgi:hypothetical protein
MGLARANLLRKLATVAKDTGRYPLAVAIDCVLYASDNPDPAAVAAEFGLGPKNDPGGLDAVCLASANASCDHGHRSTGLPACCSRYGLVAVARRFAMKPP